MIRLQNLMWLLLLLLEQGSSLAQHVSKTSPDYAKLVNTAIGTEGDHWMKTGFVYEGATYPFGMVQFTPTFFTPRKGFVINQISGGGCHHMGNFPIIPLNEKVEWSPAKMENYRFDLRVEKAYAGYYEATINNSINAQLTVSKRVGMATFTYPGKEGTVLLGAGIASTGLTDAAVWITGEKNCEGYAEGGQFCGTPTPYKVYFAAEFDQACIESGVWQADSLAVNGRKASGANSGAFFTFRPGDQKKVSYKIAISYVSLENARLNLATESGNWNLPALERQTRRTWNEYLGRIAVEGGSKDKTIQFYTHLYRSLIHPNVFNDVNGEYRGADNKVHRVIGTDYYTTFSNWDTYRTQVQLISLIAPEETSAMAGSLVSFAEQAGGGFPRWVLANIETGIMAGDPTTIWLANAHAFGARSFDTQKTLDIMRRGAEVPGTRSQQKETRPQLAQYLEKGYAPSPSASLEYYSADFAISRFALHALADSTLAANYLRRAKNWTKLYNPATQWLQPRSVDGNWVALALTKWNDPKTPWMEGTYKNYFWMVPFGIQQLVDTLSAKRAGAERRLDSFFQRIDAGYDDPWYSAANEPNIQVPWVYNWIKRPYKTQAVVRRILNEQFTNRTKGLPGNDDCGTMGAWYVFGAMGLYPVIPGEGGFSVHSPLFPSIRVKLGKSQLLIKGGSEYAVYIQSLEVNGKTHNSTWLPFDIISKGGQMKFQLGSQPNKNWGTTAAPPSF